MNVTIRTFDPRDATTLYAIFFEAIRVGAAAHYSTAQRLAWAAHADMPAGWPDKLAAHDTFVAETGGEVAGFMAATPDGYIDLAFVRPRWMGRNVAQALYDCVLERAHRRGLTRLTTHASHLARPFFARQGWQVDTTENSDKNGEVLTNFAMSLDLEETT